MAPKSTVEVIQEFAQATLALTPVIILGSGASAAHGIPTMTALGDYLRSLSTPTDWFPEEQTGWSTFSAFLTAGQDLESALMATRLTDRQTAYIAESTRQLLLPADESVFTELLADRRVLPLTRLFKHLFTSTHKSIDVITPNYDRIAEYAADAGEFSHFTGFSYGYLQFRAKDPKSRVHQGGDATRTVCVWKVHGSLDWFISDQRQILGARSLGKTPLGHTPLLITPGIDKYRLSHAEPFRTIFGCSDAALEKARSYFCVGYGFNDDHLQTKLVERCAADAVPILIVTKALTDGARKFLNSGRCRKYLALEESPAGTIAYSDAEPDGVDLPGKKIWRLDKFLDFSLGGPQ